MKQRYCLFKSMVLASVLLVVFSINAQAQWSKLPATFSAGAGTFNSLSTQVYLGGKLYMFGGAINTSVGTSGAWSLDLSNPNAQWMQLANMPKERVSAYAAAVNGKIYIVGGFYISGSTRITTPEVLEYDPASNTYTVKATMPTASYGMAGAVVDTKIYVMNGIANNTYSNVTQMYDVAKDTWSALNNTLYGAIYSTATTIGSDIYMMGGQTNTLFNNMSKGTISGDNIVWTAMTSLPKPLTAAASGTLGGNIFLAGGSDNIGLLSSCYKYDVAKNSWSPAFAMPIATNYVSNLVGDASALYFISGSNNTNVLKFVDGPAAPSAEVNPLSLTFKLKNGTDKSGIFLVSNLGTKPLTVKVAIPSKDTWIDSDVSGFTVQPGTSSEVNVNVYSSTASMAQGTYTSTVTLTTNDPKNASIIVPVTMILADVTAKRLPFLEVFTSSTCGPCKPGNEVFNGVVTSYNKADYVVIKYQQDFPGTGDPYATKESVNRRGYYGINSIPRMEIDGGWDQNASSFTSGLYDESVQTLSLLNVNSTHKWDGKKLTVTVSLDPLANYDDAGMKLYVALLERKTVKNKKSNGETEFLDVMKKMLPDEKGTEVSTLIAGQKFSKTLEFTVPGSYRLSPTGEAKNQINVDTENSIENMANLEVIAWVQNAKKEVLNAGWSAEGTVGVFEDVASLSELSIGQNYPNPANGTTTIVYNTTDQGRAIIDVFNITGMKVATIHNGHVTVGAHTVSFDSNSIPTGIYTINLTINGKTTSRTMTIVH